MIKKIVSVILIIMLSFGSVGTTFATDDSNEPDVVQPVNCEHEYNDATCTTPKTCPACGETEGEAPGHIWNEDFTVDQDPSCTGKGLKSIHCTNCEATKDITEIEKLEHTYVEVGILKEATAAQIGTKKFACSSCGDSYTKEYTVNSEPEGKVYRVYGDDRYDTAIGAADALKEEMGINKFSTIIVANGTTFADALPGSYLAAQKGAPILLISSGKAPAVRTYIKNNLVSGGKVYVLGGNAVIPNSWLTGIKYERLGGDDRYETNLKILRAAGIEDGAQIMVCTGTDFADSLSASATGKPILLVGKSLTSAQKSFLAGIDGETYYMIGGPGAISNRVQAEFSSYGSTGRVAGDTRYETSIEVAKVFFKEPEYAVLAYAEDFPDGLSGGPLAYRLGGPMVLTRTNKESQAASYVKSVGAESGYVLGGPVLISDKAVRAIFGMEKNNSILAVFVKGSVQQDQRNESLYLDEFQYENDIDKFVFYSPHQDDETLFFSQAIESAIQLVGSENVTVVLLSDGAASGVQYTPAAAGPINDIVNSVQNKLISQGHSALTKNEIESAKKLLFSKARTNEFLDALEELGVVNYKVYTLPDGGLEKNLTAVENIIRDNLGNEGRVAHMTYSYYFDSHSDHYTAGRALKNVSQEEGFGKNNVAYCMVKMEPETLGGFYALNFSDKKKNFSVLQQIVGYERITAAAKEYGVHCSNMDEATEYIAQALYEKMSSEGCTLTEAIENTEEVSILRLGVGHISVPSFFNLLTEQIIKKTLSTLIHIPF